MTGVQSARRTVARDDAADFGRPGDAFHLRQWSDEIYWQGREILVTLQLRITLCNVRTLARPLRDCRSKGGSERGMLGRANRRRQMQPTSIDVRSWIDKIEESLKSSPDRAEFLDALAILQRWQFDEMIDEESRERARLLVRRFAPWPLAGHST